MFEAVTFGDIILDILSVVFIAGIVSCWVYVFNPENKDDE